MNSIKGRLKKVEEEVEKENPDVTWIFFHGSEGKEINEVDIKAFVEPLDPGESIRIAFWWPQTRKWLVKNWSRVIPEAKEAILNTARKEEDEMFLMAVEDLRLER